MPRADFQFVRRGPQMVWILTIAALCVAGSSLLVNRIVMSRALKDREISLGVHSQVMSITANLNDQIDGFDRTLTKLIETDAVEALTLNPPKNLDAALAPLFNQLATDSSSVESLKLIHGEFHGSLDVLHRDASRLRQWHVDRNTSDARLAEAESSVKDQIQKMRAQITSLLGRERLKRITMLSAYRKASDAARLSLADSIFSQGDVVAAATPIERELADLLVTVEQLLASDHPDIARNLVENQLAQSLQRLQRLIATAAAKDKNTAAPGDADFQILLTGLLGADGRLDADSQSISHGRDGLLGAIEERHSLKAKADDFRTIARNDLNSARAIVSRFTDTADRSAADLVARSNTSSVRAWTLIGLVSAAGSITILLLGAIIARSIRHQAQILEATNRKLDEASILAVAASQAKSDFLANMSHEIRTPMSAILGYADLLADPAQSETDKTDHVRTIRRNGEHLLSIINDILDLSKIEAGKMTLESIDTNVLQIAEEVVSLMRPRAIAKGLSIESTIVYPFPSSIKSDPLRLRQVLMNLTGNAVKFTQTGGVRLHVSCMADRIRFEVIDTGIGMSLENAGKLFQPFTQADETTSRRFGGTGLGLAISQRFIALMGGKIQCTSQAGVGTTFWFELPVGEILPTAFVSQAPTEPVTPRLAQIAPTTLAGIHVLLAEDGPDNQRLFSFHLRKAGARVDVVENGRLAIDFMLKLRDSNSLPHVVLMDMQMPELDGYDATRELHRLGFATPVIALTAHAMAGDRDKCIKAGCSDYLTKPIDRAQLISAVGRVVSSGRAAA